MDYEMTLPVIEQAGFLSAQDADFLQRNLPGICENWEKQQRFRTWTEVRASVLKDWKHPTSAAKFWQARREQAVMYEQLALLAFQYRRNEVDIAELEEDLEDPRLGRFDRERKEIDLAEKRYGKISMEATAKDRMREIRLWQEAMEALNDGSFDTDDPDTDQLEAFRIRFALERDQITEHTPPEAAFNIRARTASVESFKGGWK